MKTFAAIALLSALCFAACSKAQTTQPPNGGAKDPQAPVARIAGGVITEAELAAEAKSALAAAEAKYAEEVHSIRSRTLDGLVEKRLLEAKAKKEGLTVEALYDREVAKKIEEPTESYLRTVYDLSKANGKVVPPFPQAKAEIANFVKSKQAQELRESYLAQLRAEAHVETLLPPLLLPKVDLRAEGPSKGDAGAPVTIVEFSDYECQFCAAAEPTVARLMSEYKGKVRLVFENYPLSIHQDAQKASEAALCAGEQGKYWEMHDRLFANQGALKLADLKLHAKAIGLDSHGFDRCLDSGRMAIQVEASRIEGEKASVNATPSFFVNGRPVAGGPAFEKIKAAIDAELASLKR